MNTVHLIGNFARDPELRYTQSGKACVNFTLAVNQDYNREKVDFINCQSWDKSAEIIAEYMRKGSKMSVIGRLSVRNYDDAKGNKKYITEVIVDKFEFLGSKNNDAELRPKKQNIQDDIDNDDSFPFR